MLKEGVKGTTDFIQELIRGKRKKRAPPKDTSVDFSYRSRLDTLLDVAPPAGEHQRMKAPGFASAHARGSARRKHALGDLSSDGAWDVMLDGDDDEESPKERRRKNAQQRRREERGRFGFSFDDAAKAVTDPQLGEVMNSQEMLAKVKKEAGKEVAKYDLGKLRRRLPGLRIGSAELVYASAVKLGMVNSEACFRAAERLFHGEEEVLAMVGDLRKAVGESLDLVMRTIDDGTVYKPEALAKLFRMASATRFRELCPWAPALGRHQSRVLTEGKRKVEMDTPVVPTVANGGVKVARKGYCKMHNLARVNGCRRGGCVFYHACFACGLKEHTMVACPKMKEAIKNASKVE